MPATKIMLIRHAEKPTDKDGGVDQKGVADKHDLIVRGWQRAGALAHFFKEPDPKTSIEKPATIFATEPDTGSDSKRPEKTVTPLSELINVAIDNAIHEGSEQALVNKAEASNGVVLIAWHHGKIPDIANLILGKTVVTKTWPEDRFDMVWVFGRSSPTAPWSFSQVAQMLLVGDSSTPIPTS
jgi:broad specificity phosphatase PhoE